MHGSMGWAMSSHDHSVNFLENGFAIFKVQSFESRNVTSIVEDQVQVTVATAQTDCFEALKILSNHSCKLNENKSGVFINMTFLTDEIINDINNYLQYINDQEERLNTVEYQKDLFKQEFIN